MPRTVMLLSTACCLLAASPAAADFEFSHEGHQYTVVTSTPRNWLEAAKDAATRKFSGASGALVVIDNQAENDAIFTALLANISVGQFDNTRSPDGGNSAYVWIAGTDRQSEGVWLWDGDGDGVGAQFWQGDKFGNPVGGLYNNWGTEPDDSRSNQDAAGISLDGWPLRNPGGLGVAGQWNDVDELNDLYYIVEFPVPEPTSLTLALIATITIFAGRRRRRHVDRARVGE